MIYTLDRLTESVRTAIDRQRAPREYIHDHGCDTLDINHVIRSKIATSARYVYTHCPVQQLADAARDISEDGIYWHQRIDGLYSCHLLLPRDYLRLKVVEMSDWHTAVYQAYSQESVEAQIQQSGYAGVFGTPYRPICVCAESSEGQILQLYSSFSTSAVLVQAQYIPEPRIDIDGGIDLAERVYDHVVMTTAVATLTTIGEYEKAERINNLISYL